MRPATSAAEVTHLTTAELQAGLAHVRQSPPRHQAGRASVRQPPAGRGRVELIGRRPAVDEREELAEGELDLRVGLVGDTWSARPSSATPDGGPHPDKQLNVINCRLAELIAVDRARPALAGDQLHLDPD